MEHKGGVRSRRQGWELEESRSASAPGRLFLVDFIRPGVARTGPGLHGEVVGTAERPRRLLGWTPGLEWPQAGDGEGGVPSLAYRSRVWILKFYVKRIHFSFKYTKTTMSH